MSRSVDAGTFWQALQEVDDGAEPQAVYARTMAELEYEDYQNQALDEFERGQG